MKTARELAEEVLGQCAFRYDKHDVARVAARIKQDRQEVIEACERAIGKLPVVGVAVAPYIAALVAARHAVLALAPPKGGQECG